MNAKGLVAATLLSTPCWGVEVLSLDGTWRLDAFRQPESGAVRSVPIPAQLDIRHYAASVPGCCEMEAFRAGELPDPVLSTNSLAWFAMEDRQWLYGTDFVCPPLAADERAYLVFDGVDTLADYFLNGKCIGTSSNMLIPHEFDITECVRSGGSNTLEVLLRPMTLAARDVTLGVLGGSMGGGATHEHFRKAAYMYGWDIMPHLAVNGIWKSVRLEVRSAKIDQVAWMTLRADAAARDADMVVRCRVQAPFRRYYHSRARALLMRGDKVVVEACQPLNGPFVKFNFWKISDVDLWWPKGTGKPSLYDAVIEIEGEDGKVFVQDRRRIGIRTVALEYADKTSETDRGKMLFRVNGEPIYIRGVNWTPLDAIPSEQARHLEQALSLMGELDCNLVRVWGGGVYEPDRFFDWCDENGVMVWQDFMMGCAVPPMDDSFVADIRAEVLSVVLRLRNHPSLALWAGDNENDMARTWSVHNLARDPNKNPITREVIPMVLHEYDVTRPYLPSSPYWTPAAFRGETAPCEDHLWGGGRGWWKTDYITNTCVFCSEGGAHGMPELSTIRRMLTPSEIEPYLEDDGGGDPDKARWTKSWVFRATNPYLDMGSYLVERNNVVLKQVKELFGSYPTDDVARLIEMSQIAQAERNKFQVEYFRTQKFAGKHGFVMWNLRDGCAQVSDAMVDFFFRRKRTFDAVARSYNPVLPVVGEDHRLRICNERLGKVRCSVKLVDADSENVVLDDDYEVSPNSVLDAAQVDWNGQGVFLIEWKVDGESFRSHYLYGDPPFSFERYKHWMKSAR